MKRGEKGTLRKHHQRLHRESRGKGFENTVRFEAAALQGFLRVLSKDLLNIRFALGENFIARKMDQVNKSPLPSEPGANVAILLPQPRLSARNKYDSCLLNVTEAGSTDFSVPKA